MRILYSEDNIIDDSLANDIQRAAEFCLDEEGLDGKNAEVSVTFVDKEEIRELNLQYRGIDRHTDVLSFPLIEDFDEVDFDEEYLLGDVVICLEKAREQAIEYGHSERREILYLFVHSVCHLLGFDHMCDEDKKEMRAREKHIMELMNVKR